MTVRRRQRTVLLACTLSAAIAAGSAVAGEYEVCVDVTADVRALGSDDAFVQEPARDRLSALGPAAFPALLRALENEGPAVREAIVGIFADAPQTDESVRRGVARAALKDPEAGVRAVAVPALRRIAGADSRDVVVAALGDPDPAVRRKATTACTKLCTDDAALTSLVALALDDEPLSNALQAKRVLWTLTDDGHDAALVDRVRTATLTASGKGASASRASERRALLGALLLAELGDTSQLDAVARATGSAQPIEIRIHAVHALGRLGGADRVALVAGLQRDPAVAIHANDALRRMSGRGVAGAAEAAASHTGPHAAQPLPRP